MKQHLVVLAAAVAFSQVFAQVVEKTFYLPDSFGGLTSPQVVCYDSVDNEAYVGGEYGRSVVVLDGATNGNIYVADRLNHRVQYFTSNGSFIGKWGSQGSGDRQFNQPIFVKVAPNGNVYVTDK